MIASVSFSITRGRHGHSRGKTRYNNVDHKVRKIKYVFLNFVIGSTMKIYFILFQTDFVVFLTLTAHRNFSLVPMSHSNIKDHVNMDKAKICLCSCRNGML